MRLEQMRQIATELGTLPDLAPMAGGEFNWTIPVGGATRAAAAIGGTKAITVATSAAELPLSTWPLKGTEVNLFSSAIFADRPTKMQRWDIFNLRIPIASAVQFNKPEAEVKAESFVSIVTLSLLVDLEPLFLQTVELPLQPSPVTVAAKATGVISASSTIAADLVNPIRLGSGSSFGIKVDMSLSKALAKSEVASVAVTTAAVTITPEAATFTETVNMGAIGYGVHNLTGHRVLS